MIVQGIFDIQLLHDGIPKHKITLFLENGELKGIYENEHGKQEVTEVEVHQNGSEISWNCMNGMHNDELFRFTLNYKNNQFIGGALNLTHKDKGICPVFGALADDAQAI